VRKPISLLLLSLIAVGLPAQNILNNGTFATGLMCWGEWILSNTGVDGAGDYRFVVSSDTRPGSSDAYSMEINCEGTDCLKGYIYTDQIQAPANQTYLLSYWAKCPPGGTVYVGPPGNPVEPTPGNPEIWGYATCNGNWNLNQATFSSTDPGFQYPAAQPAPGYITFGLNAFKTPWAIFDDVTLTYGDGTAPSHVVLHPGTRSVEISGNTMKVDGSPFLSLGFLDVEYSDLAQVAATGANTLNGVGYSFNSADCFNTGQKSYLDQAYELGLNFVPDLSTTARLVNPNTMAAATQTFAPHLDNIAMTLDGEPDLYGWPFLEISPLNLIADYTVTKAQSPLPVVPYFQRADYDSSAIPPYNGAEDIWMAEPFSANFAYTTFAINLFNSIQTRPIWIAQDDIGALIVPKAYFAVIGGVTGIHYWDWTIFKADPVGLAAATQVFTELNGLKNAIFGQPIDSLVTAPPGIVTMSRFDPGTGNDYILSESSSASTVAGNFTVEGLTAGQTVNVMYEGRTITASANSFSDTFNGISRHVYEISSPAASLTASLVSESGATQSRDWAFQVYNTGLGAANGAQITGLTLTQTGGAACAPVIEPGTFPMSLGNIGPSQSATGNVIINFTGCGSTSKFTAKVTVAANNGATTATVTRNNERI